MPDWVRSARVCGRTARTEPIIFYAASRDYGRTKNVRCDQEIRDAFAEAEPIVNNDRDRRPPRYQIHQATDRTASGDAADPV